MAHEIGSPGELIVGRYRLETLLGRGAHGEVWRAIDAAVSSPVAVKLLRAEADTDAARVRREASALRLVRLPGVVRLLDEGVHGERAFLVLDLVDGSPFPGRTPPVSWPDLASITAALLETVARVHAAGVVHRDLKPANVLVTRDGRPVILDFGLSRLTTPRGDNLTAAGELLGTPAYLAPEQIRGTPVTTRTDLYAVGVLLYEALSGRLPHEAPDWMTAFREKLMRAPTPLKELAPDTPLEVASAVDQLLAADPVDRPPNAVDTLRRLLGEQALPAPELPWLGATDDIDVAVLELLAGCGLDIVARPGDGRARFVREVANRLRAAGRGAVELLPATRPFGSLEPAIGILTASRAATLMDVMADVKDAVRAFLAQGGVLLARDGDALDRWSLRVLHEVRGQGPVLLVSSSGGVSARRKRPLEEADLRALFAGPDRLFHLREDAARVLWQRTDGRPRRIADELAAWVRAGIARPEGAVYRVDRDALDALDEGVLVAVPPAPERAPDAALPAHLAELAVWIGLAGAHATAPFLAAALDQPRWRVEAELEDLVARKIARSSGDAGAGHVLSEPIDAMHRWPAERVRSAHRRIAGALPAGAPRRLVHLVTARDATPGEIGQEALAAARRLFNEGKTGRSVAVLEEGVRALRGAERPHARLVEELFATWLEVATADWTPKAADQALYEILRVVEPSAMVLRLAELARAAIAVTSDPPRALAQLDGLGAFEDSALERRRQALRMVAARSCLERREQEVLAEVTTWAEHARDADVQARLWGWRGRLAYRHGRFDDAADWHARSAAGLSHTLDRVAARINAASAQLEAFRHDEAWATARQASSELFGLRHPFLEARAEWVVRAAEYRLARATGPDLELAEAVATVGVSHMEALVCSTEAAVAWRAGRQDVARRLALRAAAIWSAGRMLPEFVLVMRCLAAVCGEPMSDDETKRFGEQASGVTTAGAGIQAMGLLAMAKPHVGELWRGAVETLAATVPSEHWGKRIDVLSVNEARAAMKT